MAPGTPPSRGRKAKGQCRFACPGEPADCHKARTRQPQEPLRHRQVFAGQRLQFVAPPALRLKPRSGRARLGSYRRAARKEQREQRGATQVTVFRDIAIPHRVRLTRETAAPQIHQQKRQVVEHVGARDPIVELDRIEERRPAVEQNDVAQVQVAVALPHQPGGAPLVEQRSADVEFGADVVVQLATLRRIQHAAPYSANPSTLPSMTHAMPALPP